MMTVYCSCGKELTISKQIGLANQPKGIITVVAQCPVCMYKAYDRGWVDEGGVSGAGTITTAALLIAALETAGLQHI